MFIGLHKIERAIGATINNPCGFNLPQKTCYGTKRQGRLGALPTQEGKIEKRRFI